MSSNKKIIGAGGDVSTSEVKMHSDRILMFDVVGQKKKSGPKSQEPQNIIRRAGGLKGLDLKYSELLELYELWCNYFKQVLSTFHNPDERLLKTDFHGCILYVSDSPNPSQIGIHGICLHESKSTFQLLTKANKVAIIQKEHTSFQFVFDNKVYTLFGDSVGQRSFTRGKKFKGRLTLPYFLPLR